MTPEAPVDPKDVLARPLTGSELVALATYLDGLDSPWHSPESLAEWHRLFARDCPRLATMLQERKAEQ
jgi:hypothetical protein